MGLKATRTTMSSPLLMPPCTPPERLVGVRGRPPAPGTKGSLCVRPVSSVPAKPLPISKAFEAGQREQAVCEIGFELVEDRLAEAGRDAARDAFYDAAQ